MQISKLQQQFLKDLLNANDSQKVIISVYYRGLDEINIYGYEVWYLKAKPIKYLLELFDDWHYREIELTTYRIF